MKAFYMMLSGVVLSIIATLALAGLLSVSELLNPNRKSNDASKKDVACIFSNAPHKKETKAIQPIQAKPLIKK